SGRLARAPDLRRDRRRRRGGRRRDGPGLQPRPGYAGGRARGGRGGGGGGAGSRRACRLRGRRGRRRRSGWRPGGGGLMARILVVDDEPDVLLFVRIYLEAAGHQTILAADGERALE